VGGPESREKYKLPILFCIFFVMFSYSHLLPLAVHVLHFLRFPLYSKIIVMKLVDFLRSKEVPLLLRDCMPVVVLNEEVKVAVV